MARSLARNIGPLAPKGANFGASLCSMNFQYPKFGRGSVQRPVVFAETGSNPRRDPAAAAWNVIRRKAPDHLPRNLLYRMIA
jgi:hypothetical protein